VRATTVLAVRDEREVALAADGQITLGQSVMKAGARKLRRLHEGRVLAGFAGSTADAIALFSRFEDKLAEFRGSLMRAAVELSRDWRTDRALRRLEALLVVADAEATLLLSGTGDVIEPDDGVLAIGSGSTAAMAAARALRQETELPAAVIAERSLQIAAALDIYTNDRIAVETLAAAPARPPKG
jgi:ATP-dependent HslUV protease subunit HslV